MKLAIQMYSVRTDAEQNLYKTLETLKSFGYEGVELAGLYGNTPLSVAEMLSDLGLCAVSAHVPLDDMRADIEKVISDYKAIGCKNLVVPWLKDEDRPCKTSFGKTIKDVARFGRICAENGMTLHYHNHDFEFVRNENGVYALNELYSSVSESILKTELDVCWVSFAGESPVKYIDKYSGRIKLLHLKDYVKDGDWFEFRPVGFGTLDFKKITDKARSCGIEWLIVEQDEPSLGKTRLECAEMSINHIKSL